MLVISTAGSILRRDAHVLYKQASSHLDGFPLASFTYLTNRWTQENQLVPALPLTSGAPWRCPDVCRSSRSWPSTWRRRCRVALLHPPPWMIVLSFPRFSVAFDYSDEFPVNCDPVLLSPPTISLAQSHCALLRRALLLLPRRQFPATASCSNRFQHVSLQPPHSRTPLRWPRADTVAPARRRRRPVLVGCRTAKPLWKTPRMQTPL